MIKEIPNFKSQWAVSPSTALGAGAIGLRAIRCESWTLFSLSSGSGGEGWGGEVPEDASRFSLSPNPTPAAPVYLFGVVGTSRCDVRAACSGATLSNASAAGIFVLPATPRAETAQRAIPTIALSLYAQGGGEDPWVGSQAFDSMPVALEAGFRVFLEF
jgi:hypothetical protein